MIWITQGWTGLAAHSFDENGSFHIAGPANTRQARPVDLLAGPCILAVTCILPPFTARSPASHVDRTELTRRLWRPPDHPSFTHFCCAHTSPRSAFRPRLLTCLPPLATTTKPYTPLSQPLSPLLRRTLLPPSILVVASSDRGCCQSQPHRLLICPTDSRINHSLIF